MTTLIVLVILAISSTSSHQHKRHFEYDKNDDVIHPPWWHPNGPALQGPNPGYEINPFNPGGGDGPFGPSSDPSVDRWHPWDKRTTTEGLRITYPIFQPSTTTGRSADYGSSARSNSYDLVLESCKAACHVTDEYNPVCGTDNVSYDNIGILECACSCGVDVQLKSRSLCSSSDLVSLTTANGRNINDGDNSSPDNPLLIVVCLRNCPVTSEYNPVCGSNNVTYPNPGRLECARNCGVDVSVSRRTACNAPVGPTDATAACIQTCSVTSEYNPVCGTNNITYQNSGRLECAKNCGLNVDIMRRSSCSVPPGPDNPDLRVTTKRPNGNGNANGNSNGNGRPNGNGNWNGNGNGKPNGNGNWNGNGNGKPNGNGNWNGNGNGRPNGNGKPNGNGNWNGNNNGHRNPSMKEILTCIQVCPITPESNPVCGTDGVTYSNPGKLLCAQFCGVDVRVRQFASCTGKPIPNPNIFVCPTLPEPTDVYTNPPQDCIDRCDFPQTFKPVCGSDGVTYMNSESIQCKINCGVAVSIWKHAPCGTTVTEEPTPQTPPVWGNTMGTTQAPSSTMQMCINNCATSQEYSPVCGTDGVTYANLQRLQCSKRCGTNVAVKSLTPCFNTPSINGNKEDSTEENGLGFTIPADVLASVFPNPNAPTQPTTIDSDESYELDVKFGETTKSP